VTHQENAPALLTRHYLISARVVILAIHLAHLTRPAPLAVAWAPRLQLVNMIPPVNSPSI
jgi:hypothetical protein